MKKQRFDFDGALKEYFQTQRPALLLQLTGGIGVKQFLNVELPTVRSRKVDLLLLLNDGTILHVEFQSSNHRDMALRMAEYYVLLKLKFGKPVRQIVLYFGNGRLTMADTFKQDSMAFSYELLDIRSWSADDLLASEQESDQVLALLAGGRSDTLHLIRDVLGKIALMSGPAKERALAFANVLSGLRGFERIVFEESISMGQLIDWKKNAVLREMYDEAVDEGLEKGRVEGREEGREEGRVEGREEGLEIGLGHMIQSILSQMFGPLPRWAQQRIKSAKKDQLEMWGARVAGAKSLENVIGPKR